MPPQNIMQEKKKQTQSTVVIYGMQVKSTYKKKQNWKGKKKNPVKVRWYVVAMAMNNQSPSTLCTHALDTVTDGAMTVLFSHVVCCAVC